MKNPLLKRLPKELLSDIGKYIVIFLFMSLTIGFISGFLVASGSMIYAYDNSFEKYNVENGNFELEMTADDSLISALGEEDVTLYENYYFEQEADTAGETNSVLRIFKNRTEVNKVCIMEGALPAQDNEIALDRMYAENNDIKVGDTLHVGDYDYIVSGYVALSDYSALFSDNNDTMFDSLLFGVAIVTDRRFAELPEELKHYSYSWKYKTEPVDEKEEKEISDHLMEVIYQHAVLKNFIPRYINQAINFTGGDLGGDRSMMVTLLYIVICIMAFIFAVTINNTITKEASTIGTLRASGYTRGELFVHYMGLPVIVTLIAAVIGNILGYTFFKNVAASMYYGSYSLTTYVTRWNAEAFMLTTIVPLVIMLLINGVIISRKLRLSPLKFIRHDLSNSKRKKALKLPKLKFFHRFRIRVILQNMSSYVMLFVGICFADVLLLFGLMMSPLLEHFQEETLNHMIAGYQYVLKVPVETESENAEKYCVTSLKQNLDDIEEEITVYGIADDSKYFDGSLVSQGVLISDGYAEKYKLKEGDTITLKEPYGDKTYKFRIEGIFTYPSVIAVFMPDEDFKAVFEKKEEYFSGYFSDVELTDIDETMIATCITEEDLTKVSRQLDHSMGNMFYMFNVFAVGLFLLLLYLLTKLIIEKNTTSISMVKILGYENSEINRLYITSTTIMVIVASLIGIVVSRVIIGYLYYTMMKDAMSGWLTMYIQPLIYPEMFLLNIGAYAVVAWFQMKRIKKIPMDEALKNVE